MTVHKIILTTKKQTNKIIRISKIGTQQSVNTIYKVNNLKANIYVNTVK